MSLHSPFSHRLRTNYIAHPDEETTIKEVIEAHSAIVSKLDHEVKEIEEAMAALETQRKGTASRRDEHLIFADSHRMLLSSILHLPADVLLVIFSYLIPEPADWSLRLQGPVHPIIRISQVCHQWRALAVSTPVLWATISILELPLLQNNADEGVQVFERRMQQLTDIVSTLVSRVAMCPITLRLVADDGELPLHTPTCSRTVQPLVALLRQTRWREIDIQLSLCQLSSPLKKLLEVPRHSDDTIRKARFRLYPDSKIVSDVATHDLNLHNAKRLTSLEVFIPGGGVAFARINWGTITDLKLPCGLSVGQASSVLSRCPSLVQCTIELDSRSPSLLDPPSHLPPVTLLHLHTLILSGYQPTEHLAQSLTLPSLRVLSILDITYYFDLPFDVALPEWIRIYGNQLKGITFSYGRLTLPTLLSSLESLPNLISLDIRPPATSRNSMHTSGFHRSALLAMTPRADEARALPIGACSCPKLETTVIDRPDLSIGVEDWVTFISSRRRQVDGPAAYLKSAEIFFSHVRDALHRAAVQETKEKVYLALRARGVSPDGIVFYVNRIKVV